MATWSRNCPVPANAEGAWYSEDGKTECSPTQDTSGIKQQKSQHRNEPQQLEITTIADGSNSKLQASLRAMHHEMSSIRETLAWAHATPGGAVTKSQSRESLDQLGSLGPSQLAMYSKLDDMIHISGPLTEDAVVKTLQARFLQAKYHTNVGPVLLSVNPNSSKPPTLALQGQKAPTQVYYMCQDALQQLNDTGQSQTIVLSGYSGSGKTFTSQLVLRELLDQTNTGVDTAAGKHLSAALTVLYPLCNRPSKSSRDSSCIGLYIQLFMENETTKNFKMHHLLCGLKEVLIKGSYERSFHIFRLMKSCMTDAEKAKFHMDDQLHQGTQQNVESTAEENRRQFDAWKGALGVLGIQFADVMRILAAILLLGNIKFIQGEGREPDVHQPNNELKSVAALMGISAVTLYKSLTAYTKHIKGQFQKTIVTVEKANLNKACLAQALYCRMLSAIFKRINTVQKAVGGRNTSKDSIGTQQSPEAGTSNLYSPRHSYPANKFIGVLDMFGFSNTKDDLDLLCTNLCAETLQQYYITNVFQNVLDAAREEGVQQDMNLSYTDNVAVIDLISAQEQGIMGILDDETRAFNTSADILLQKLNVQFDRHQSYKSGSRNERFFAINHFAGPVTYDATDFILANHDQIPDDIIWAFSKHNCNFGFVSHLFSTELRSMQVPQGNQFRILTQHSSDRNRSSTYCEDFHNKLDSLLKILVQTRPHFILCFCSNKEGTRMTFDRRLVADAVRAHQVLETVHLMAAGFPHKIRYKTFNARYHILLNQGSSRRGKSHLDQARVILEHLLKLMDKEARTPYVSAHWSLGSKHIFLSESCRQQLERARWKTREQAATTIQVHWKSWQEKKHSSFKIQHSNKHDTSHQNRMSTENLVPCQTSNSFNISNLQSIDLDNPPPLPPARAYTILNNMKVGFPQTRVMLQDFTIEAGETSPSSGSITLRKGQEVKVTGVSSTQGCLTVCCHTLVYHVPYQYTQLKISAHVPVTGLDI